MKIVNQTLREFVVTFRAPSAPIFSEGPGLAVSILLEGHELRATFRTRRVDVGQATPLPGNLWIDARGHANSIEHAVSRFGNCVAEIVSLIAFCANASIGDIEPELAFDNSPKLAEREFFQNLLPQERPLVHTGRKVDKALVIAMIGALQGHSEKERIGRAITHYCKALGHWRWGDEVMATAHLYIGMETLTQCVIRLNYVGLSDNDIAARLSIDPAQLEQQQSMSSKIAAEIRRQTLFQGDGDCYKKAKAASDGLEHGFMAFDEVRDNARAVRDRTAQLLRQAVLSLLPLDQQVSRKLLGPPFDKPIGHWPLAKYVRGELVGDSDQLAAPGNEYPIMTWQSKIERVELTDQGQYQLSFNETVSPCLGKGISFRLRSFEVWAP